MNSVQPQMKTVNELYLAGERVPPGTYRLVGGNQELLYEKEEFLPISLDGKVVCYERVSSDAPHTEITKAVVHERSNPR